ncbi:hypothetical protein [Lacinutrix chionoecetis]
MKKLALIFLLLPLFSFNVIQTESLFVGKWKGEDKGDIGVITLEADSYATFEINDEVFGGPEFEMDGKRMKMTYAVNTKTTPIQLDFIMTKMDSDESRTMKGIVKFEDENTMRLAIDFSENRATTFTEDNSILLFRSK